MNVGAAGLEEVELPEFGIDEEAPQMPASTYRRRLERLR